MGRAARYVMRLVLLLCSSCTNCRQRAIAAVAATIVTYAREDVQEVRGGWLRPSRRPDRVGTPSNHRHQLSSPPRSSPPLRSIRRLRASPEPAALPYRFAVSSSSESPLFTPRSVAVVACTSRRPP